MRARYNASNNPGVVINAFRTDTTQIGPLQLVSLGAAQVTAAP